MQKWMLVWKGLSGWIKVNKWKILKKKKKLNWMNWLNSLNLSTIEIDNSNADHQTMFCWPCLVEHNAVLLAGIEER